MGSTLESAICFSLVLLILTMMIIFPASIWKDSRSRGIDARTEIRFHLNNRKPRSVKEMDGYESTDMSPEVINTMISGLTDAVKIAGR